MRTQDEIYTEIEELIPGDLWLKYNHLTFGEMARIDELQDWAEELAQAEEDWWA